MEQLVGVWQIVPLKNQSIRVLRIGHAPGHARLGRIKEKILLLSAQIVYLDRQRAPMLLTHVKPLKTMQGIGFLLSVEDF